MCALVYNWGKFEPSKLTLKYLFFLREYIEEKKQHNNNRHQLMYWKIYFINRE